VEFEGRIGLLAEGTLLEITGYILVDVKGHCCVWPYEVNRASAQLII
jgi:hypothetical protein